MPEFAHAKVGSGSTRRQFLQAGALSGAALLARNGSAFPEPSRDDRAVIFLLLVGGPSQLETFDPKPDAPAEIRGPFGSIATRNPGVRITEHLPLLARRLDRVALIRSMHHDAAPIHETGLQLVQTGGAAGLGAELPHAGSAASHALGKRNGAVPFVVLPGPITDTGVQISRGQSAGPLGPEFDPVFVPLGARTFDMLFRTEPEALREAYGRTAFGRHCLAARRLTEIGTRVVVVNMFTTVFGAPSWDCHGHGPFSTLHDYKNVVLPTFDRAVAALVDDLERRGRLGSTLVVATGEFGRTPWLNAAGGRDHWPGVWSAVVAGGGVAGGQVIGASDPRGAEPADRPVAPAELVATIYRHLGLTRSSVAGSEASSVAAPRLSAGPIAELFG